MTSDISFKLDQSARLWVRPRGSDWKLASREEAEQVYRAYPEIAVQAFWMDDHSAKSKALVLAA